MGPAFRPSYLQGRRQLVTAWLDEAAGQPQGEPGERLRAQHASEGGASVSEQPGRDRHRWKTLFLVIGTHLVVLGTIVAVVMTVGRLDEIGFLRFPLGFYLLAQGLLIGIVAACFWSAGVQERIDRSLSESEEL
jgi:putative solute:sodium symporter small subunit